MELEKYVILKRPAGTSRYKNRREEISLPPDEIFDRRGGVLGSDADDPPIEIDVAALNRAEISELGRDPNVDAAAPDIPLKLIEPSSTEPSSTSQSTVAWGLDEVGALRSSRDGTGVKVAILDTGIDPNHEAFAGVQLSQEDFTGEGDGDLHGHGTHCAGTVFGRDIGDVRIGVARGVTQAFIGKVLDQAGTGTSSSLIRAIGRAADVGCQVISMSLSFDWPKMVADLVDGRGFPIDLAAAIGLHRYRSNIRLFDALGALMSARSQWRSEILLVAAAGNESKRNINTSYEMPAAAPSEATGFFSVGAVGRSPRAGANLVVASFSNTLCDACAPGVDVVSAEAGTSCGLVTMSGTSMATPHVAGVAALWLQHLSANEAPTSGYFTGRSLLRQRLEGSTRTDRLELGFNPLAVGLGVVQGPS